MEKKKVFLSYAHDERDLVMRIMHQLQQKIVSIDYSSMLEIRSGENIADFIQSSIVDSDLVLAFVTERYLNREWTQYEIGHAMIHDSGKVFLIILGEITVPGYMNLSWHYHIKNIDNIDFSSLSEAIMLALEGEFPDDSGRDLSNVKVLPQESYLFDENGVFGGIKTLIPAFLSDALVQNRLTLICGAGVSIASGIPDWETLIYDVMETAFKFRLSSAEKKEFKKNFPESNLIIGEYLKLQLGKNFTKTVQDCLYSKASATKLFSALVLSIVRLADPAVGVGGLESIVTTNFDSILEYAFKIYRINYRAIYKAGMPLEHGELPIYHVHGYLPKARTVADAELVFSEDEYHTQFIEPYKWSNLTILHKLMENSCLFVGHSLTDPNIRRLLDITKRNVPSKDNRHAIIKALPKTKAPRLRDRQIVLEEQDANRLGLDVIWVNSHADIPDVIDEICGV